MELEFLGVRGLAATPDPEKLIYGGNSLSAVVTTRETPNRFFVLDAGTGLARFGSRLQLGKQYHATVLLSQIDLYTMIGFQFTPFAFSEDCQTEIWGPHTPNFALESIFDHIMSPSYSPVYGIENLLADVVFKELEPTRLQIDTITVTAVNFPKINRASNWGYRLENQHGALGYIVDSAIQGTNGKWLPQAMQVAAEADALIIGAFAPDWQRPNGLTYENAIALAKDAGVKRLFLTYHHPEMTDADLHELQDQLTAAHPELAIILAAEGMALRI